jgi:ribosomal protein L22
MAEDPEKSAETAPDEEVETPSADSPSSSEPEAAAAVDTPRGESSEDAPTSDTSENAPADEEPASVEAEVDEAEADDGTRTLPEGELAAAVEEAAEAAPKPRRRRRRGAEAEEAAAPEKPKAPATRRRRAQRDPNLPPPVVRAQAKYVRSSARKARLVCDHIRGKSVEEARAILAVTPRAIARDWSKLLESAVANAEHNHELVGEDLYVKAVHADEGPTIPRFRPRAMGRATKIRKRTSHLTILLTPKD